MEDDNIKSFAADETYKRIENLPEQQRADEDADVVSKHYSDQPLLRAAVSAIPSIGGPIDVLLTARAQKAFEGTVKEEINAISVTQKDHGIRLTKIEEQTNTPVLLEIIQSGQDATKEQLDEILIKLERDPADAKANSLEIQKVKIEIRIEETCALLNEGKFRTAHKRFINLCPIVSELNDESVRNQLEGRICGLIGICCWRSGEMEEANRLFAKAFALQPKSAKACSNAAYGALLINKPDDALRLAKKALELEETNDEALSMAVQSLYLLKRNNEIEPLLERHPEQSRSLQTLFTLGNIALKDEDYKLAKSLAIEICDIAPDNPMAYRLYFDAHYIPVQQEVFRDRPILMRLTSGQRDNLTKAERAATKAIELTVDWESEKIRYDVYGARAGIRELMGEIDAAISDCDEMLRIFPNDENAHYMKGEMLLHFRRDFENAIIELQQVHAGDSLENARVLEAEAWVGLEKWDKVIEILEPHYTPDAAHREQMDVAHLLLQAAYFGEHPELVTKLKNDLETQYRGEVSALVTLAELSRWQGNLQQASDLLSQAAEKPEIANKERIIFMLAQSQNDQGNYIDALNTLEPIVDITEPNLILFLYLRILMDAKREERAVEISRELRKGGRAIQGVSEHEAFYASSIGDFNSAAKLFEELSEDHPSNVLYARNAAATLLYNFLLHTHASAVQGDVSLPDRIERARIALKRIGLDDVRNDPHLAMNISFLRLYAGYSDALEWAYCAWRSLPQDSKICGDYCHFVMAVGDQQLDASADNTECAIEIKSTSNHSETKTQTWIITRNLSGGEYEITPSNPIAKELIRKQVGDTVIFSPPNDNKWKIVYIKSKYLHAFHQITKLLAEGIIAPHNFVAMKIDTPEDLAKKDRENIQKHIDEGSSIQDIYNKFALPVSALTKFTGSMVPNLWRPEHEYGGYNLDRFYSMEGSERELLQHRNIALQSSGLVLDWTALISIVHLDVGDFMKSRYPRLVVPQRLADEVRVYSSDQASSFRFSPEGKERQRKFVKALGLFIQKNCEKIEITDWNTSDTEIAKTYGSSTIAAIRTANQEQLPLWSDDLRLRKLAADRYNNLPSISVQWLLLTLRKDKYITENEYFEAIKKLIYAGYGFLWISIPFLLWVFGENGWDANEDVRFVLNYLSYWNITEEFAVSVVAQLLIRLWKEPLLEHRRRALANAVLGILPTDSSTFQIVQNLKVVLNERLILNPSTFLSIVNTVDDWSKQQIQIVKKGGIITP